MARMIRIGALLAFAAAACSSGTPVGEQDPGTGTTSPPTADAGDEFLALAKSGFAGDDPIKVTVRLNAGGEEEQTLTWARRGDAASFRSGSGDDSSLLIDPGDGTGVIICSRDSCVRYGGDVSEGIGAGLAAPFLVAGEFVREATGLPGFSSSGSRTIAGRAASCAAWSYFGASAEACVDEATGIMLSWRAGDGSTEISWEAVEIGEPTDADFEPTGPVQDLPYGG